MAKLGEINSSTELKAAKTDLDAGSDDVKFATSYAINGMSNLTGKGWFLDEDAMTSNSATKVASQQSIKAYVDSKEQYNPYCFGAVPNTATTLVNGVATKISFDTEIYDYNNNFASSTYTSPIAQVFHVDAGFTLGTVASGVLAGCLVYVNGSQTRVGSRGITSSSGTYTVSCDILLAANDTVEIYGYQSSAGDEDTVSSSGRTYFSGHLVHKV